ncbi:hypothetical protein Kfla_0871 [Kribbella flavida DSM 17836]|uniref:Uncharacterized protein n=1 Tax=Kribbella flavida (strain DSM 17836 / JCM 10339 / NBRC 14399) TaxID=479435 RepID=D2PZX8_KRIFD|nr:hypothetical protein [Kribbella flavida]ADB29976.1 hypothetical protein Kfla_0871 [Kribbella flavida DSM 17836]
MRDIILIVLGVSFPAVALWQIWTGKLRDRAELLIMLSSGVLFLLFARATIDWNALPPRLWLIGLAVMVAATALAGRTWSKLTWVQGAHPARRTVSGVVQVGLAVVICAVLL